MAEKDFVGPIIRTYFSEMLATVLKEDLHIYSLVGSESSIKILYRFGSGSKLSDAELKQC
jgi:hypothetical protein